MTTGPYGETYREQEKTAQVVAGGSIVEAICGLAAIVLAVLGLLGIQTFWMLTISGITLGAALLIEGAAIGARINRLRYYGSTSQLGSGASSEFIGGLAGGTLSVLALLGIQPMILMPTALIIFGGAILLGSGGTAELSHIHEHRRADTDPGTPYTHTDRERQSHEAARQSVMAASGAQVLVGLAAITLGVLALLEFNPLVLTFSGLIAVGASVLFSGTAIASRLYAVFSR